MIDQSIPFYPWLQAYWDKLSRYQSQDRLPNGIMLVGGEGLGLTALAKTFAQRAICLTAQDNQPPCGVCASCLLFKAGNYPDFYDVQPEEDKTSIGIDTIRQLSESLALSSQYTKPRIVIINPAAAMLHQASNSLLKTLEEPSDNTCLILLVDKVSQVSATIRSRCQLIAVKDINLSEAKAWLENQGCEHAEQYLNLANHLPILADELWQKEALVTRTAIFNDFVSLVKGGLDPILFAEKCLGLKELPVLNWVASWITDIIKCSSNADESTLLNPDLKDDLKVLKKKLNLKSLYGLLDKLNQLMNLQSSQLNQQLLLEDFVIQCYVFTVEQRS